MKKGALFLFLISSLNSFCQKTDSISRSPVRPAIYLDYAKAITSLAPDSKKIEGGFELMFFNRIQTILEFGQWDIDPDWAIENGSYHTDGTYKRFGFGYLPYVDAESRIGLGLRFGSSRFSDKGEYIIVSQSGLQEDIVVPFQRNNLSANWFELVFYTDKEVNKWLVLGLNLRVRFMQSYDSFDDPDVQLIPGYGRAQDKSIPAFNLFLKIQPF